MNILWLPHSSSTVGARRRDVYFHAHLRERHTIYTVEWEMTPYGGAFSRITLKSFVKGFQFFDFSSDGLRGFHVRRIPDLTRPFRRRKFGSMYLNQYMFRNDVRRIVAECGIDVVIAAPTSYMTGFPPFDLPIPVIFDYLDCSPWEDLEARKVEERYFSEVDAVIAVSGIALERASSYNDYVKLIPNGADIGRMRAASGATVRSRHGIGEDPVVSLIGLTHGQSLYFLDSIELLKSRVPNLKCLLVGRSPQIEAELRGRPKAEDTYIYVGPVSYDGIADYFAASDVGLYPVDQTPYFDAASPIKLFEYTAAGKPVVLPPLTEARRLGFRNLIFASPTAGDFADGISRALEMGQTVVPEVEQFDWSRLALELENFIAHVVARKI